MDQEALMSLRPLPVPPVPEETARIVRAAFPKGHRYVLMRDELGTFYTDDAFAALFAPRGQPAECPWRLALVTILQFVEGLSDEQAADAARGNLAWKYALSLELADPGFDASVLSEFRTRLIQGSAEELLLDRMLGHLRERRLLRARGQQRTDATHVLAAVRGLNRLELVGETVRVALDALAQVAPAWLAGVRQPTWAERYGTRVSSFRLPRGAADRARLALEIGQDGVTLLAAVDAPDAPAWLREVPALVVLRRVWLQNYLRWEGEWRWRAEGDLPPASVAIRSPHDAQARLGLKRGMAWVGYKAHLTEAHDPDLPHLITDVHTAPAPQWDGAALGEIQESLARRDLLPAEHLVDAGYVDAPALVRSQASYGITLLGPAAPDTSWQAQTPGAYAAALFAIDWDQKRATCPAGRSSVSWREATERGRAAVVEVKFSRADCGACPVRARCTRTAEGRRSLTLRPAAEHAALEAARARQATEGFARRYAQRAGIEGTIGQGVTAFGLRRSRYVGVAKTHLHDLLTAAAMNFARVAAWLAETPPGVARRSAWLRILDQAACA
jgi:transposase